VGGVGEYGLAFLPALPNPRSRHGGRPSCLATVCSSLLMLLLLLLLLLLLQVFK
jgi:hypothetical protein